MSRVHGKTDGSCVGGPRTVWRIGDVDRGTNQFAQGWFFADNGPAEFHVGVDDPAERWPGWHPGPLSAWTGWEPKSAAVVFDLPDPKGTYELVCELYAGQGPCPQMAVEVNGTTGLYFLDVRRNDRTGITGTSPISGWATLRVPIEATKLVSGENRIVLTTVAVDPVPIDERGAPHPEFPHFWGSSVMHAGLELRALGDVPLPAPHATLTPLPLYRDEGERLVELVDLIVTAPAGFAAGTARVALGDDIVEGNLTPIAFGQARLRLSVPDRSAAVPAEVRVHLDGEELRFSTTFTPCRKWTLHLLPHVHLDLGYTDYQAKILEGHSRSIDRALDIIERQPDYAYSVDGSMVVDEYLATRSRTSGERLRSAFARGNLRTNAFSVLFLTGLASLEECYRAGYRSAAMRREQGLTVDYANLTDVPSYSGAIPSIVAALGLDAFLGIQNHGRAATQDSDDLHLRSPFVWEGPDGARMLTFFAEAYAQLRYWCGHPPTIVGCADAFSRVLRRYERDDYLPSDLPIVGINADNEDLAGGEADVVDRWNAVYAWPRLRFSTVSDYVASVRPLSDRLPVVRGDGGSYWEDGVGADAATIAAYRRAQGAVAAAEAAAALVAAEDPMLAPARAALDRAWDALVIGCEHTWTSMHATKHPDADQTTDQLAWKRHQVASAGRIAADELRRALSQLGERVTTNGPSLLVLNPISVDRACVAELELPPTTAVVDADGHELPVEVVDAVDELQRVRVHVGGLPAFGYGTWALASGRPARPGQPQLEPVTGAVTAGSWRLLLDGDRGGAVSLRHTGLDIELLDASSEWSLGQLLYVAGGGTEEGRGTGPERTTLFDRDATLPEPQLEVLLAAMKLQGVRRFGEVAEVVLAGEAPSLPRIETTLRLEEDRVGVHIRLTKEATLAKESVYVAFPFALTEPTLLYDRQQGWVDPAVDHLPGACNEWFTVQQAVALCGPECAVTWTSLDAPLFVVGDVVRGRWPRRFTTSSGTLLSWVMNNYWWTNFPARQSGELELRYAFTASDTFDAVAAGRFGRDVRCAPAAIEVGWMDKMDASPRALPATGALLSIDAPDHLVVTTAAPRVAGHGLVLRIQDIGGRPGVARVRHPRLPAAWRCSAVEDDVAPLPVDADGWATVEVGSWGVVTLRLGADGEPSRHTRLTREAS